MKKIVVLGMGLAALSGLAGTSLEGAKWIGSNAALTPEIDFSSARWVHHDAAYVRFDAEQGKPYELVATAEKPFTVGVNGREIYKWGGHHYDGRFLTHINLTPFVVCGENEVSISLQPGSKRVVIAVEDEPDIPLPGVASRTLADIIGIVRTGEKVVAATAVDQLGEDRGAVRDTDLGRRLELREETASPAFAKRFSVRAGVKRATLAVTGLGFYEASLDGKKVGDLVLDPAPTDYDDRVLFSTYELGELSKGEHTLSILLGHGWYDMRTVATWNFNHAVWRDFPRTCARLEIAYEDGTTETVVTDGSWEQVESPVAYDCIREGEVLDARCHTLRPYGFKAAEVAPPRGKLEERPQPGAKVVERFVPERVTDLGGGRWLVTFPQTISGWVACTFRGLANGDVVTIRYDENLGDGGKPARATPGNWSAARLRGRRAIDMFFQQSGSGRVLPGGSSAQTDHFISAGGAVEAFEPRFVYHGFRHVLLEGLKAPLAADDIAACRVMTDFAETGSFACSDETLTELVRLTHNSYKANFTDGVPTDCPHREKLAWTGDGWIASEFGLSYYDTQACYRKWARDIADTMRPSGEVCCIAPTAGWGYNWGCGPVFDAALAMVPWNLWLLRGDRAAVEEAYPSIAKYLAYEKTRETSLGLVANGLGDWNATVRAHMPSNEYVISCARLMVVETAARMAGLLGRADEQKAYERDARQTREALRVKYDRGNGVYENGGQTAQALAVAFGLARDEAEAKLVADRLVDSVLKTGCHIDFGLVGAKFVYRALSDIGRTDLAYRMIVSPTLPSMTKWIGKNGTLWEDFTFGSSKCHIMLGDFAAWAQQYVAGLRRPAAPGYAKSFIAPTVLPGMTWAKGCIKTPHGELKSDWTVTDGRFELKVTVPAGTEAEIRLPDGTIRTVAAGSSSWTAILPAQSAFRAVPSK